MFDRPFVLALSLLALTSGCRAKRAPSRLVAPVDELRVYNRGARAIGGVRVKACRAPETEYRWLEASRIAVGGSIGIPMFTGCVDLSAVSDEGQELGRQFDLNMIPGSTWEIR